MTENSTFSKVWAFIHLNFWFCLIFNSNREEGISQLVFGQSKLGKWILNTTNLDRPLVSGLHGDQGPVVCNQCYKDDYVEPKKHFVDENYLSCH